MDVIHMSNNGIAHSNVIATSLQWKIGLHKADLQETKKMFHIGMIFQECLIVQYLPIIESGMR